MLVVKVVFSVGTVWTIVYDRLRVRTVGSEGADRPAQGTAYALQHLFRYHEDPAFLERIVTGDKSWCHHYEPETKRDSMQGKHT
ncbi:hypothetical protein HNY73_010706 [Argiope bruennichi]|uniref:Uncharacterized protein n=1 Tax=Argiope bruennichi TaxID=94029 RepID=A0A8T0F6R8_ARGBR|nr:hypothetical protein HNY73_010706 [Argiope bruennichi]